MELALSLGDASTPSFLDNLPAKPSTAGLDFRVGLGFNAVSKEGEDDAPTLPLQLDLLPFSPIPRSNPSASQFRLPWLTEALGSSEVEQADGLARGVDVNQFPASGDDADDGAAHSSPNSAMSSFQMEFGISSGSGGRSKRDLEDEEEKDGSRGGSDDDENGSTRKKLRLSKDQSAFLEESFKEHSTLNPKQKLELAKQLNLRPRQVEVWFQNRRARTKLKQTEIDCEYLKRCCETLTEENRRLQKELQELRVLKTSQPFYMQLPATTLTMCPSCERVATTSSASAVSVSASASAAAASSSSAATTSGAATLPLLGRASARAFPFSGTGEIHVHKAA